MSLKDRLNSNHGQPKDDSQMYVNYSITPLNEELRNLKEKLHILLIEKVNTTPNWSNFNDDEQKALIRQFIDFQIASNFRQVPINKTEKERLIKEIIQDTKGFGPLDPLLEDPGISDILVNGAKSVYIEKNGKLYKTSVVFKDNDHLKNIIERIVSKVGRRIDEKSPMVDARLPDGSRVNAIIPPLAIDGPSLSIRRFKKDAGTIEALLRWGSMSKEMADVLQAAVRARCNIIISGGTGAGKTTLLNSLSARIPAGERIITIEDSAELSLKQDHVVRLETRPKNIEGEGEITTRDLVINALRMRPDRIVIGECRGAETLDMLQAMNTGHDGSLTTLHANSPRDALARLETMVLYAGVDLPSKNIRQQISSAINIIVQASRLQDGSRKVTRISEITGMEENVITMQDIFVWKQTGISDNMVIGAHVSSGVRPEFMKKIERMGIEINGKIFDANYKHSYIVKTNSNDNIRQSAQSSYQIQTPPPEKIQNNSIRDNIRKNQEGDILRRLHKDGRSDN